MATRLYLPSTGSAAVTPAVGSGWTASGSAVQRAANLNKIASAMASTSITVNNSSSTASTLFAQYVSPPLAAQTLSGNVIGQMRFSISNATGATCVSRIYIRVINSSGTVVATILAGTSGGSNLTTTLTNKRTPTSTALSSYACSAGDRISIEAGIIRTAGTTSRTGNISFGDDSATDLAVDDATTTANNPYVEFDGNFTFIPDTPTSAVVDDVNDTFGWTFSSGFPLHTDYEYTTNTGSSYTTCTGNPQKLGNNAYGTGVVGVRVKAAGVYTNSSTLYSASSYSVATRTVDTLDFFRRGEILETFRNLSDNTSFDYFRRGEPLEFLIIKRTPPVITIKNLGLLGVG